MGRGAYDYDILTDPILRCHGFVLALAEPTLFDLVRRSVHAILILYGLLGLSDLLLQHIDITDVAVSFNRDNMAVK